MPIKSVQVETKELEKAFKEIEKRLPTVTARAMNELAAFAKARSERETAKELKVPQKLVKKRLTVTGIAKAHRSEIHKATKNKQFTYIIVYMRGIPVGQIAGKPAKTAKLQRGRGGVKAKGGRFYRGSFYAPGASPHGFVFKRRGRGNEPSRKIRAKLMMPKIGVRRRLAKKYNNYIAGNDGINEFKKRWNRLANRELSKISG